MILRRQSNGLGQARELLLSFPGSVGPPRKRGSRGIGPPVGSREYEWRPMLRRGGRTGVWRRLAED